MAATQEILTCVETWSSLAPLSFSSACIIILHVFAEKSLKVLGETETSARQAWAGGAEHEWVEGEPQREKLEMLMRLGRGTLTGLSY